MKQKQLKRLTQVLFVLITTLILVALAVAFFSASKKLETPKVKIENVGGLA